MNRIYFMAFLISAGIITYFAFEQSRSKVAAEKLPQLGNVSDFALVDSHGAPFHSEKIKGKTWIVSLTYTNCKEPCTAVNETLAMIHKTFMAKDLKILSISSDPTQDTPLLLLDYAHNFRKGFDQWFFLTGETDQVHKTIKQLYKLPRGKKLQKFTPRLVLVDTKGQIRGFYDSRNADAVKSLIYHAAALMEQKSV